MLTYTKFWRVVYFAAIIATVGGIISTHHVWRCITGVGLGTIGAMHIYWRVMLEPAEERRIEGRAMALAWDLYRAHMKDKYGEDWHE